MAQQHLDRLTAVDASFLHQEGPARTCTSARVVILEGPPPHVRGVPRRAPRAAAPRPALPPEARRTRRWTPAGPLWVDDPDFNLEYHVRQTALPAPGSEEQLMRLAARIFSQQLDRSKPLWEMWLVEGLEDGGFALISKTHHALIDGIARRRPRDGACSTSRPCRRTSPQPDGGVAARARADAAPSCVAGGRRGPGAGRRRQRRRARVGALARPAGGARRRARGGRGRRRDRLGGAEPRARRRR